MSTMYLTAEEWNTVAGALVEWNALLQMDRRDAERKLRDCMMEADALRAERDELAEQSADLGAALEASKKRVEELTAALEKANVDNAELVKRTVENVQAVKREAV